MPKTISSLPTGAINKTDNLITASSGSDELKRNTVNELLQDTNTDIEALQNENKNLKAQITELEGEIDDLNTNLKRIVIMNNWTSNIMTIAVDANTNGIISTTTPSGYEAVCVVNAYAENGSSGTGRSWAVPYCVWKNDDDSIGYEVRNYGYVSITVQLVVTMLYRRTI